MIEKHAKWVFLAPAILIIVIIGIYPLIHALWASLTKSSAVSLATAQFVGLDNYTKIFGNWRFWNTLKITGLFVLICVPLELIFGFIIALAFDTDSRLLARTRAIFIIPTMIAPVAVAILWRLMYQPQIGIINFFMEKLGLQPQMWLAEPRIALFSAALVDIWQWTPFMFLILLAGLRGLPKEVLEAGSVDGTSYLQSVLFIRIPLLRNVILIATLLRFLDAIRTFDTIYVLTYGGPASATDLYSMLTFREAFKFFHLNAASALSIVFLIIVSILVVLLFVKILRLQIELA